MSIMLTAYLVAAVVVTYWARLSNGIQPKGWWVGLALPVSSLCMLLVLLSWVGALLATVY